MSNRAIVFLLLVVAVLAWGGLRLFGHFIAPHSPLAFIAFFLILGVACTSTFAPLAYVIGARFLDLRVYKITIRHSLRQGALLALVVILNLILSALHSWNIFTAVVILAAAVVVEVLSLARK
jgi:hypothetical protein